MFPRKMIEKLFTFIGRETLMGADFNWALVYALGLKPYPISKACPYRPFLHVCQMRA